MLQLAGCANVGYKVWRGYTYMLKGLLFLYRHIEVPEDLEVENCVHTE
jgi:hypothetical protein